MIDTRNSVSINQDQQFQSPPPARFDDDASAQAQPVQPLPTGGVALWTRHFRHVRQKFGGRTRGLALVVISGLTIGAASGAMLASRNQASVSTQETPQSTIEKADTRTSTEETLLTSGMSGAEGSATAKPNAFQPVRIRRHRSSLGASGQPRAYRVAVLK